MRKYTVEVMAAGVSRALETLVFGKKPTRANGRRLSLPLQAAENAS
jgi:hypothetical protein